MATSGKHILLFCVQNPDPWECPHLTRTHLVVSSMDNVPELSSSDAYDPTHVKKFVVFPGDVLYHQTRCFVGQDSCSDCSGQTFFDVYTSEADCRPYGTNVNTEIFSGKPVAHTYSDLDALETPMARAYLLNDCAAEEHRQRNETAADVAALMNASKEQKSDTCSVPSDPWLPDLSGIDKLFEAIDRLARLGRDNSTSANFTFDEDAETLKLEIKAGITPIFERNEEFEEMYAFDCVTQTLVEQLAEQKDTIEELNATITRHRADQARLQHASPQTGEMDQQQRINDLISKNILLEKRIEKLELKEMTPNNGPPPAYPSPPAQQAPRPSPPSAPLPERVPPSPPEMREFNEGDVVRVTGGRYDGQTAEIVKVSPQKCRLKICGVTVGSIYKGQLSHCATI